MRQENIRLPRDAMWLLQTLHAAGYSAYVVGGCVRDSLLGRQPGDWDICTSARPDQMRSLYVHIFCPFTANDVLIQSILGCIRKSKVLEDSLSVAKARRETAVILYAWQGPQRSRRRFAKIEPYRGGIADIF